MPIGVGDEADGGVECRHRLHPGELQRVQRQIILEHEDQVDQQHHEQIGRQQVKGVSLPVHRPAYGVPADQPIYGPVDRVEDRIQPGLPIHDDFARSLKHAPAANFKSAPGGSPHKTSKSPLRPVTPLIHRAPYPTPSPWPTWPWDPITRPAKPTSAAQERKAATRSSTIARPRKASPSCRLDLQYTIPPKHPGCVD